jgi:sugar phosphate isomerase/epimerase
VGASDLPSAVEIARRKLDVRVVQVGFFEDEHFEQIADLLNILHNADVKVSAACLGHAGEDYTTIASIQRTGGFGPDEFWGHRWTAALRARDATQRLGASLLTMHVGCVPDDRQSPDYATLLQRVRQVADALAERQIDLGVETGTEPAGRLARFLADLDCRNVMINFDPANMILYGTDDPTSAINTLQAHIRHVHMKDAVWSALPGQEWGREVRLGDGDVDVPRVVSKLRAVGYQGPLLVEGESGPDRVRDMQDALELLDSLNS